MGCRRDDSSDDSSGEERRKTKKHRKSKKEKKEKKKKVWPAHTRRFEAKRMLGFGRGTPCCVCCVVTAANGWVRSGQEEAEKRAQGEAAKQRPGLGRRPCAAIQGAPVSSCGSIHVACCPAV